MYYNVNDFDNLMINYIRGKFYLCRSVIIIIFFFFLLNTTRKYKRKKSNRYTLELLSLR